MSFADGEPEHQFFAPYDPYGILNLPPSDDFNFGLLSQMTQYGYQQSLEPGQSEYGNHGPSYHHLPQSYNPQTLSVDLNNPVPRPQPSLRFNPYGPTPPIPAQVFSRLFLNMDLNILGNYETWSPAERENRRRILHFTKHDVEDIIQVDCHPIDSNDYRENMITISCIRLEPDLPGESQQQFAGKCIFTSVDIICLLERLVDLTFKFSVPEKNRIRRNIQGFKPLTVRKEGPTAASFQQIMNYVSPRTRNIEKDIKVFLWIDLTKAIRKIVSKYKVHGNHSSLVRATDTPISQPLPSDALLLPAVTPPLTSSNSSTESLQLQLSGLENNSQGFSTMQRFNPQGQEFGFLPTSDCSIYDTPTSISAANPLEEMGPFSLADPSFELNWEEALVSGEPGEFYKDIPREFT